MREAAVAEHIAEKQLDEVAARKYRRRAARNESYYLRLKRQRSHIRDFQVIALIGKGGYGEVYLARWTAEDAAAATGGHAGAKPVVVLKRMTKAATIMKNEVENVKRERDIMTKLNDSVWIAKLLMSFQDNDNLYFAMEASFFLFLALGSFSLALFFVSRQSNVSKSLISFLIVLSWWRFQNIFSQLVSFSSSALSSLITANTKNKVKKALQVIF